MAEQLRIEGTAEPSTRQRKKRKWDQPAESIVAASASIAGLMPLGSSAALAGMALPGMFPSFAGVYPTSTASAQMSLAFSTVQQSAAAIIQKINQDLAAKGVVQPNKIQDEVIAREIVINDAEPGVRYKLTKRQTQEEIQSKTGAVVITRGKYKPPNAPADHEKPLYLHISAGTHLKDTAERVRAVDQAAALVDEMLKQGRQVLGLSTGQLGTSSPLTTVVFVDFEADPSLDLMSRIRGPNDQYINHIMHETGATVLLKGGACENSCSDEIPQPLHLLISAEHAKSLEDARSLAEHLIETIRSEVIGARPPYFAPPVSYNLQQLTQLTSNLESRNASLPQSSAISAAVQSVGCNSTMSMPALDLNARLGALKNYSAVPPPQQLLTTDIGSGKAETGQSSSVSTNSGTLASSPLTSFAGPLPTAYVAGSLSQTFAQQTYGIYPQASQGSETYPSYSAYSGLYPQASPLQQVALALQRPASSQGSVQSSSTLTSESVKSCVNTSTAQRQAERQERQRRKFQEGPSSKRDPLIDQVLVAKQMNQFGSLETAGSKLIPPPRTVSAPLSGIVPLSPRVSMLPPPPVSMPSPTMLPFPSLSKHDARLPGTDTKPASTQLVASQSFLSRSISPPALTASSKLPHPETRGIKLVEYGEDEDEDIEDEDGLRHPTSSDDTSVKPFANGKPFWAV